MINSIVIDDELDVLETFVETINEVEDMTVIGTASTIPESIDVLSKLDADVVFLDIKLRGGDAFSLLRKLKADHITIPPVILNTGFEEFDLVQTAINEFKGEIILVLKKPFWEHWDYTQKEIRDAVNKDRERRKKIATNHNFLKFKYDYISYIIPFEDIVYIESDPKSKGRSKLKITTIDDSYRIMSSLALIINDLNDDFMRVSRYSIINRTKIKKYDHTDQMIYVKGKKIKEIGVGESYKNEVLAYLK